MKTVELVARLKCINKEKKLTLSQRQFPSSDLICYRMRSQHELLNTNSRDDGNLNRMHVKQDFQANSHDRILRWN